MTINEKFYRELRCRACRDLLGYEYIFAGRLVWTCRRCGELNQEKFKHPKTKENIDIIDSEYAIQAQSENPT